MKKSLSKIANEPCFLVWFRITRFKHAKLKSKKPLKNGNQATIPLLAYQTKLINYLEESLSNSNNHWVKSLF